MRKKSSQRGSLYQKRNFGYAKLAKRIFLYFLLLALVVTFLFPFLMMFMGGFKDNSELLSLSPTLLPKKGFKADKYIDLFTQYPYAKNLFNSFFVAVTNTFLSILFCSMAGFAFAKYQFPGKDVLFLIVLASMMIPIQSIVIPSYLLMRKFGWLNTFYPLIIPMAARAFGVFFMRQYIKSGVPDALLDAARLDGCSELKLLWKVVLPAITPAITVLTFIIFMASWNAFMWPLIVLNTPDMFTFPVVIQAVGSPGRWVDYGVVFAASTLAAAPMVIIFLILQRYFISAVMSGFLKG